MHPKQLGKHGYIIDISNSNKSLFKIKSYQQKINKPNSVVDGRLILSVLYNKVHHQEVNPAKVN